MSASIETTAFATFSSAVAGLPKQRGMALEAMPLRRNVVGDDGDDGFDISDASVRLVVRRDARASKIAEEVESQMMAECTDEGADADADADCEANADRGRDVVIWARQRGDPTIEIRVVCGVRIMIVLCSDAATEEQVAELIAAVVRTAVVPFDTHPSRAAWKEARRPVIDAASEWTPSPGDFDVPINRRIDSIVESANKRMRTVYNTVFARKLASATRATAVRWSKKGELKLTVTVNFVDPEPEEPTKTKSSAKPTAKSSDATSDTTEETTDETTEETGEPSVKTKKTKKAASKKTAKKVDDEEAEDGA